MQAVVLAGGLATRLGDLSARTPKSMLDVLGRPFVAWQLERLRESGVDEAVLCIGHLGDRIRSFVGDGAAFGLRVRYSEDGPALLGTGGALRRAAPQLAPAFLVTYGDSYLPFDYTSPLRDLEAHPEALGTMSVFFNESRWDASNTEVEGELVKRYVKGASDPAVDHIDYGATALRREALAGLSTDRPEPLERLFTDLAAAKRLRALRVSERFYEIGSSSGLAELTRMLASSAAGMKR